MRRRVYSVTPEISKGVKAIYDSGDATADRYTVFYSRPKDWGLRSPEYAYVAMSALPFHPQGFAQHGTGRLGRHNGKRITFVDLPADCQTLVLQDIQKG